MDEGVVVGAVNQVPALTNVLLQFRATHVEECPFRLGFECRVSVLGRPLQVRRGFVCSLVTGNVPAEILRRLPCLREERRKVGQRGVGRGIAVALREVDDDLTIASDGSLLQFFELRVKVLGRY